MKHVLLGGLLLAAGCAASTPKSIVRPKSSAAFSEHALHLQSEAALAQGRLAERDHMEGTFKRVSLRSGSLSKQRWDDGDGMDAGIRLDMDRPFRVRALAKSLDAAGSSANFTLEAARREADALTCEESVSARAEAERVAHVTGYRAKLERLLQTTRNARTAGTIDPASAARAELQLERRIVDARTNSTGLRIHPELGPLPVATITPRGDLDRDFERLGARIEREHPEVLAHVAAAKEHEHAATAEARARLPWLDFVQLDVGTEGSGNVGGRFSIEVPLDEGSRGRAERERYESEAESYEALSKAVSLAREALRALEELHAFEQDASHHVTIDETAQKAEALADRMLEAQAEAPDKIAQLVAETLAARMSVLDARERAGLAACMLLYTTGTGYDAWPRGTDR